MTNQEALSLSEPPKPLPSAWAVLAAMRWVLASIVLIVHLKSTFTPSNVVLEWIVSFGGKAAVIGFFLISGYSIAHSYGERPDGYIRRRFLRIYPLYLVAVLFTQFVVRISPPPVVGLDHYTYVSAGWGTSMANLLLLQEFVAIPLTYNVALWSLSIEVFYYLLAPILYRQPRFVIVLLIAISLITFQVSRAPACLYGYNALVFLWPWLIGFLLARDAGRLTLPICLGLAGAIFVFLSKAETVESLSVVTYLVTFAAILLATRVTLPEMARKIANLLGDLSYPLYLFHLPLAIFFFTHSGIRSLPLFLVSIIGSTAIFWYIFDEKLKRWLWIPVVDGLTGRKRKERIT